MLILVKKLRMARGELCSYTLCPIHLHKLFVELKECVIPSRKIYTHTVCIVWITLGDMNIENQMLGKLRGRAVVIHPVENKCSILNITSPDNQSYYLKVILISELHNTYFSFFID